MLQNFTLHSQFNKFKDYMSYINRPFNKKDSLIHMDQSGLIHRPILNSEDKQIQMTEKVAKLMSSYIPKDIHTIQESIVNHVQYTLARTRFDFKKIHCYQAVAHSVRDRLIESFNDTHRVFNKSGKKRVYYLSLQFLIGRCLQNALININLSKQYETALKDLGYSLENLYENQVDPALGNGGLGRLAACFLDSLATLNYPAWGYGIRYDYGIFRQLIKDGYQVQIPDYWLSKGNTWQIQRTDVQYKVKFNGKVRKSVNNKGEQKCFWEDYEVVIARAYDTPIPGYATFNTIGLRLWKSFPVNEFDFTSFNSGQYYKALENRQKAEYITSVLYPNDSTEQGKQLRLKQEYLLVSATLQDIIRRHKMSSHDHNHKYNWQNLPQQAAIQLNDTHPTLAIVQLLRILVDQQNIEYKQAWKIVYRTFSYTNHTVLPQALQKWSVQLLEKLLPRHLQLIYLINHEWLHIVNKKYPKNEHIMSKLSIVEESNPKKIIMANLSIVGSHKVNGVAFLHSQLLKKTLFHNFCQFFPHKFINVTNGVTTRRWVMAANPYLAQLYSEYLQSDEWVLKMQLLKQLEKYIEQEQFQSKWRAIKQINKKKLADWIQITCNQTIDPNSMFDIQVKRIHEYKRQFMNVLYLIYRYRQLKDMKPEEKLKVVPRTAMFSGKAAPAYTTAKNIIKLINSVADVLNNDKQTNHLLKLVFLPNYNVSNAQIIIPASDLSQHISTAGTQASGTSNMKFCLNGGLIIGTMDGANVQICEQVGEENIFIFGARVEQVDNLKKKMSTTNPNNYLPKSLQSVIQCIREGTFGQRKLFLDLVGTITNNNDWYLISADFDRYIAKQRQIDAVYLNKYKWTKMSILNSLRTGKFSSDRTIKEYANLIWGIQSCQVINNSKISEE